MEASTLQAPAGLARKRIAIGAALLRLRSDEQLVALFRVGHEEAFRVIHDRYRKRLLAYSRQMLPHGHDAEDALQDVFVRAYAGLGSSDRELALRAWLFRIAHNRCIDELRRPTPPAPEVLQLSVRAIQDPVAEADRRESLRRLIVDVRRLPDQQRSALLMREMGGMPYTELAETLGTSVPAVKSLLVRARIALTQAATARDTACSVIREELAGSHDRGVRPNANAKRHMRDCAGCRSFRRELRAVNRRLAALAPFGPIALLAKTLGLSSGAGAGSGATATGGAGAGATASGATAGGVTVGGATAGGATAGGGAVAIGGAAGGGAMAGTGAIATGAVVVGTGHVATLLAAVVATAGGAVAISAPASHPANARPAALVQSTGASATAVSAPAAGGASQDGAAAAVGASLIDQSKLTAASQAAKAKLKQQDPGLPQAPSSSSTASAGASSSTGSTDGTGLGSGAIAQTTGTLGGASTALTPGAGSPGTGSTEPSSGTSSTAGTGTGTASSGASPSGSSPSGSTASSGSPGSTSNTTNNGTGSSSTATDTASGTGTGSRSGSPSTGTSTSTG